MNKPIKELDVLSLFNGMGCIWLALDQLKIKVNKRYSSEIDKYANIVNDSNYPNTIQLGDIAKWKEWNIDWSKINLITAGSPCQGFSFAGNQLNFNDPRSALFFVFVDILNYVKKYNPNVKFLLENVKMKKEYLAVISQHVGVFPVMINSNLLSAQNRKRYYWTNIKIKNIGLFPDEVYSDIPKPNDNGILLKDILQSEDEIDNKYYIKNPKLLKFITNELRQKKKYTQFNGIKSLPLLARMYKNWGGDFIIQLPHGKNKGSIKSENEKTPAITSSSWQNNNFLIQINTDKKIRRLTPIECERLQTIPDNYTICVSDSQRYKMLGNGWTIEIISWILSFIKSI